MTDKNHTKFEEKELRFRQTLSALPDGVVLLRKDLVIQWMNRIAERDLSLDPEKDVGKKLTDVFTNPEFIQHIQSERWKPNPNELTTSDEISSETFLTNCGHR